MSELIGYSWMTVEDFGKLPTAPCQRNTDRHARRAADRHLKEFHPSHVEVAMAQWFDADTGQWHRCKLNGHTRWKRWQDYRLSDGTEGLKPPEKLSCAQWRCDSLDDLVSLYRTYDNPSAAEDAPDVVTGTLRLLAHSAEDPFLPRSPFVKSGRLTLALQIADGVRLFTKNLGAIGVEAAIREWLPEIRVLDGVVLNREGVESDPPAEPRYLPSGALHAGIAAAVLVYLRLNPGEADLAVEFVRRYANDEGRKDGKLRDGVQALAETAADFRAKGRTSGTENQRELAAKAYSAINSWVKAQVQARARRLKAVPLDRRDGGLKETNLYVAYDPERAEFFREREDADRQLRLPGRRGAASQEAMA